MRLILLSVLMAAIFVVLLTSCSKSGTINSSPNLEISFDVEAQNNVATYVIQTSVDGKTYSDKGSVVANNANKAMTYTATIFQPGTGYIYLRIKSVDLDESFAYSFIQKFKL